MKLINKLDEGMNNSIASLVTDFDLTSLLIKLATWISIVKYLILPLLK